VSEKTAAVHFYNLNKVPASGGPAVRAARGRSHFCRRI